VLRDFAPDGEVLVGYVGRLAAEKRVSMLRHLTGIPGLRLVVVSRSWPPPRAVPSAWSGRASTACCTRPTTRTPCGRPWRLW
jgi:hypothetical protein